MQNENYEEEDITGMPKKKNAFRELCSVSYSDGKRVVLSAVPDGGYMLGKEIEKPDGEGGTRRLFMKGAFYFETLNDLMQLTYAIQEGTSFDF